MASFVLLAVCFGLIIYKAYKYMFFKPPNFPPGIEITRNKDCFISTLLLNSGMNGMFSAKT